MRLGGGGGGRAVGQEVGDGCPEPPSCNPFLCLQVAVFGAGLGMFAAGHCCMMLNDQTTVERVAGQYGPSPSLSHNCTATCGQQWWLWCMPWNSSSWLAEDSLSRGSIPLRAATG